LNSSLSAPSVLRRLKPANPSSVGTGLGVRPHSRPSGQRITTKGIVLLQNNSSSRSADQSANDIASTRGAVTLIVGSVWVDCLDDDFSA
jgi:hypothetical protein